MTRGTAQTNGITVAYETFGDPNDETILLIMGLGAQLLSWPESFCTALVEHGYHVVRFDNRDVGESTYFDTDDFDAASVIGELLGGAAPDVPYLLGDMADDAAGLIEHLGVESVHVVGASMGGMIAQQLTISHPAKVRSLTSIMSTTGEPHVGQADGEVLMALMKPRPSERDEAIAAGIELSRVISSPDHFDPELARERATAEYDRAFHPDGVARQLLAIVASPPRNEGLADIDVPTLVVHGRLDPLVTLSGGERTAELIPGAELMIIDDMAHDVPEVHHERITKAIVANAAQAGG